MATKNIQMQVKNSSNNYDILYLQTNTSSIVDIANYYYDKTQINNELGYQSDGYETYQWIKYTAETNGNIYSTATANQTDIVYAEKVIPNETFNISLINAGSITSQNINGVQQILRNGSFLCKGVRYGGSVVYCDTGSGFLYQGTPSTSISLNGTTVSFTNVVIYSNSIKLEIIESNTYTNYNEYYDTNRIAYREILPKSKRNGYVVTGSYIGNGGYGYSNQNFLTFYKTPRLVIVFRADYQSSRNTYYIGEDQCIGSFYPYFIWCGQTNYGSTMQKSKSYDNFIQQLINFSLRNNTLYWYSTSEPWQMNSYKGIYNYIAIV